MRNITVLIEGNHKDLYPNENISVTTDSEIFVRCATVYWDYSNVIRDVNDTITFNGDIIRFVGGYWTFDMLTKLRDVYVAYNETTGAYTSLGGFYVAENATGGCTVYSNYVANLGKLAPLVGFDENTALSVKTQTTSPNPVDINRGLKYITVSCDMVDETRNTSVDGRRSNVIATIPVPNGSDLKRTITQHHTDAGSVNGIPLRNGCFNNITFDVDTNIGPTHVGSILLELCISDK